MDIGQVYYDANSQWILNIVLACIILGISLDLHLNDFKAVSKMPKAIFAGLLAQFAILPAVTGVLTLILDLRFCRKYQSMIVSPPFEINK